MRGKPQAQPEFLTVINLNAAVPTDHPLRAIKRRVDAVLKKLSPLFDELYEELGRPSIPPEQLLKSRVLTALYSVRSERLFCEQLRYNLLWLWFLDREFSEGSFNHSVFAKNYERVLSADVAKLFFAEVYDLSRQEGWTSDAHFTADGTLIEAWASLKSFVRKDGADAQKVQAAKDADPGNPSVNFRGEPRRNDTHQSTTDPDARLYRKGNAQEAKLSYLGHVLMENRSGLAVAGSLTSANGFAEREAALALLRDTRGMRGAHATLGADRAYDTADFVHDVRAAGLTPHVAQNTRNRRSAIDGRTTRHPGYRHSGFARRRIERIFGWLKTIGLLRKARHRGRRRVGWLFTLGLAAQNLVRMRTLLAT